MKKRLFSIIVAMVMMLSVAGITMYDSGRAVVYADAVSEDGQYEYIMTVDPIPDQVFTGDCVYPKVVVRINGKELKQKQITVNYYNHWGPGYGFADVELVMDDMDPTDGIDFTGTDSISKFNKIKETVKFKILDPRYKNTEGPIHNISKVKNYYYTGKPIRPDYKVWGTNVYLNKYVLLKEGVDYTARITKNIKPGRGEIQVTGITYAGIHGRTFKILKAPVKLTTVSGITDRYYNGKAQFQNKMTVTYNGMKLKKGRDYTVSYKNNKKAGKASVIIKGKGTYYTGTVTKTFNIVKGKVGKVALTSVKSTDHNAIKVTWKKAKNAKKYQVWRATSKNGKYKLIKTTTANTFTNKNLTTGKKYYYKVRAINGTLNGQFSVVKSAIPALKQVSGVKAETSEITTKLTWSTVNGAKSYQVYRANDKDGVYKKIATVPENSYIDKNLTASTQYYYKIRAYKTVNSKFKYGKFSAIKTVKTKAHQYICNVIESTCTEDGYTQWICKGCGHEYHDNVVPAGHDLKVQKDSNHVYVEVCTRTGCDYSQNHEHKMTSVYRNKNDKEIKSGNEPDRVLEGYECAAYGCSYFDSHIHLCTIPVGESENGEVYCMCQTEGCSYIY